MGLDASHDCWHGAYSAFTRWRNKIAEVAGYEMRIYEGEYDESPVIDWDAIKPANVDGEWDETPTDPLVVLIAHSDCGGLIHPAQAGPLADRLEALIPLLPDEVAPGHVRHWRATTQRFVDGLRAAVAAGEDVKFS